MKTTIKILIFTLLLSSKVFSQQHNFAEVYVVNGVEVYILSEPVREYEIVYGKEQSLNWGSYLTKGLVNSSISSKVNRFVKGIVKKAAKDEVEFDAIIYTNGKNVVAVKFTDEETKDNKRKARVHRLNGIPIYVMCEPYKNFRVAKSKGGGIKWKSAVTRGIINNSIEEDLLKFARKYKKMYSKGAIDALYYTGGKACEGIKFEE